MTESDPRELPGWNIPDGEFAVYGTVYTVPEHADDLEAVYRETTRLAQAEEGTVYYCISRDQKDSTIFHFFERYRSKEDFHKHNEHDIIKKLMKSGWMKDVKAVFTKPLEPTS